MNNRFKALEGLANVKPRKFAFEMMWVILHVRHSGLNIRSRWNSFLPKCSFFLVELGPSFRLFLVDLCFGSGGLAVDSSQALFQESLRNFHVFWASSVVEMPLKLVLEASWCIYAQLSA